MKIIHATPDHLPAVAPLFDAYRQFYRQPPDLPAALEFLGQRLANRESVIFLALDGDEPLGFVQLYPSFSSVSLRRLWILNDLFVAPAARGRGAATALITQACDFARADGAKGLVLETAADNPAQQLYERLGWQRDTDFYHYSLNL
ncbi:MAG TPA: GNAT family N-acetyltransferase [Herpetosiphonaceae bacterium]